MRFSEAAFCECCDGEVDAGTVSEVGMEEEPVEVDGGSKVSR